MKVRRVEEIVAGKRTGTGVRTVTGERTGMCVRNGTGRGIAQ